MKRFTENLMIAILISLLISTPIRTSAQTGEDDPEHLHATTQLFQRITELTPAITEEPGISTAVIRIQGYNVALNGPFWQLVRGWIRLYYEDLQTASESGIPLSEDEFLRSADDYIAKSFLELKVGGPLREGVEHIAVGTADIGARLGAVGLVTKATGEVAEGVLSKMFGGGGLHFFCHAIDAAILFGLRRIQTAARIYNWSRGSSTQGLSNLITMAFVSSIVRRTQNKVRFVLGPVSLNEETVEQVDREGPNRYWGWLDEGKRATWLRGIAGQSTTALNQREFRATRMKRYLWLKSRSRGHRQAMRGTGAMDTQLNQNVLWILAVQESILQRALDPRPAAGKKGYWIPTVAQNLAHVYTADADDIREGLAEEYSRGDPAKSDLLSNLLRDVEVVFNPQASRQARYVQAVMLETLVSAFLFKTLSEQIDIKSDLLDKSWLGIWGQARLRWKLSRISRYIYEWGDFLRLSSLQTDGAQLSRTKYETMEAFLKILADFERTRPLAEITTAADLKALAEDLHKQRQSLAAFRPWREKRIARSWIPFRDPTPTCRKMESR